MLGEEDMALVLPLCPISEVMSAHHCEWPAQPDERAKICAKARQPERAVETIVNKLAVHAQTMTAAENENG